jgi:hypothetical protein
LVSRDCVCEGGLRDITGVALVLILSESRGGVDGGVSGWIDDPFCMFRMVGCEERRDGDVFEGPRISLRGEVYERC